MLGGVLSRVGPPPEWTDPLDNRIATSLPGGEVRIDDLAARTARLASSIGR